jgi:hypothetical protein
MVVMPNIPEMRSNHGVAGEHVWPVLFRKAMDAAHSSSVRLLGRQPPGVDDR